MIPAARIRYQINHLQNSESSNKNKTNLSPALQLLTLGRKNINIYWKLTHNDKTTNIIDVQWTLEIIGQLSFVDFWVGLREYKMILLLEGREQKVSWTNETANWTLLSFKIIYKWLFLSICMCVYHLWTWSMFSFFLSF